MTLQIGTKQLHAAFEAAAQLAVEDPAFLPIFERLEAEVKARAAQPDDALTRARAAIAQRRA
jgi:hypothetical protein